MTASGLPGCLQSLPRHLGRSGGRHQGRHGNRHQRRQRHHDPHPDLAAFVGTDSTAGIGAATAVSEANKVGQVKTVAMDRNSDVLQKIQKGTLTGTVAQDDAAMAFWALQVSV